MRKIRSFQLGILFILINSILWGISPLIIKVALVIIPPCAFLFYRFLWVILFKFIEFIKSGREITKIYNDILNILKNKYLILSAFLFNFATLVFYFKGLYLVTPLQAGVLAAAAPLFVILPMVIAKKEKLTLKEVIGILIMLVGYIFLIIAKNTANELHINWMGVLYITMGNLVNAIAIIINKKYLNEKNRMPYEFVSSTMAFLGFWLLVKILYPDFLSINKLIVGLFNPSVLYMAVFGTLVALTFFNKAMFYLEASEAISFLYSQPLFLAIFEMILKVHSLSWDFMLGIIFLLFGIIFNILGIFKEHASA